MGYLETWKKTQWELFECRFQWKSRRTKEQGASEPASGGHGKQAGSAKNRQSPCNTPAPVTEERNGVSLLPATQGSPWFPRSLEEKQKLGIRNEATAAGIERALLAATMSWDWLQQLWPLSTMKACPSPALGTDVCRKRGHSQANGQALCLYSLKVRSFQSSSAPTNIVAGWVVISKCPYRIICPIVTWRMSWIWGPGPPHLNMLLRLLWVGMIPWTTRVLMESSISIIKEAGCSDFLRRKEPSLSAGTLGGCHLFWESVM